MSYIGKTPTNVPLSSSDLDDGIITTAKIANVNVTTAKILDNNITLAKLALGTDGNLISYDASGNPVAVATGSSGQVLTSAGAGAVPSFQTPNPGDITGVIAGTNLSGGGTSDTVTINLADASTSVKGAASFNSDNFTASSGVITIKDLGIATAEIQDDAITTDKLANSINLAITANTAKTGITSSQASAITANTAKVTNATHSGDVTGATTLTIADNAVTLAKMAPGTDGNLISYDANGDPVAIAAGTSGQILTSAGAGAVPSFQDTGPSGDVTITGVQTLTNKTLTAPKITSIVTISNADIELAPNGTGHVTIKGNNNDGTLQLNCTANSHGQQIKSQPHSTNTTNVMLLPEGADSTLVSRVSTDTLTNKTINASQLVDGSVATGKIADDAITLAKMAVGTDGNLISVMMLQEIL